MSFRIEDILKDSKCPCKEDSGNEAEATDLPLETNLSRPLLIKSGAAYADYHPHYLQYVGGQSLDLKMDVVGGAYANIAYQSMGSCCSRLMTPQVNETDKIYSSSYMYPEKFYPQTTYNHILPLSFPIYNHYSKRRNQVRFSTSQTKALEHKFSWQKYLSPEDRKLLAYSLKLSDRQVKTWFQNRRAKWRRNITGSLNGDTKTHPSNPTS
ncbi:uncharacterized protein [Euwallacea similis]|uniref:uncharacterized protein n=1 Tax=Euwallacea similis TaxID=1736056 RepID=UPI00344D13A4